MKPHYNYKIRKILILFFLFSLLLPIQKIWAQTITENQPLSFGKIVLANNSTPRQIELFPSGTYTADPEIIFFNDPQLGNITVDGYAPLTVLSISVGLANLTTTGGTGSLFSLSNSFTVPSIVITNLSGSATFDVGATLTSDGGGLGFADGFYDGTYSVTVTPP